MQILPDGYRCYTTPKLDETLKKLRKSVIPERFGETVKKLEVDPYRISKQLKGPPKAPPNN